MKELVRWSLVRFLLVALPLGTGCGSASLKSDGAAATGGATGATDAGGTGGAPSTGTGGSVGSVDAAIDTATDAPIDAARDAVTDTTAPSDTGAITDAANGCARPKNCSILHACSATTASGNYMIFPDGAADAGLLVHCDMETAGGGWTVIFLANAVNLNAPTIDYTVPTQSLRDSAQEALIAFRNLNLNMVASSWASFGLPATWRTQSPLSVTPFEDLTVSASVNGALPALAQLRYGQANFSQLCSDPWVTTAGSAVYGRVCLQGTTAAFYSGFGVVQGDFCSLSTQNYAATVCSDAARFSIAVR